MRAALLLLCLTAVASAAGITRTECREGEGDRHGCRDGSIFICSRGIARMDIWVDRTAYYRLGSILRTNDSGDHQRNEAFYLRVYNSRRPEGLPLDPNCGDEKIIPDSLQDQFGELGVFYLMEGEANRLEMHHYCGLWREGRCGEFFREGGEGGCGCNCNCESTGFAADAIVADEVEPPCEATGRYPVTEVCDGLDNDCDGQIDEDDDGDPYNICEDCAPDDPTIYPTATEVCDGRDNNCDGRIDEGVANACGGCAALYGEPGVPCGDNDCGVMECASPDELRCVGGEANACGGCEPIEGVPGAPCGVCGVFECAYGGGLACVGDAPLNACGECGPIPFEVCDGVDNDCDGEVDEEPQPEQCNCADDDCDGQIDDEVTCPGAQVCAGCACVDPCGPGGACPEGTFCSNGGCVPMPCPDAPCPPGLLCRDWSECVDPCEGLDCPEGCANGACFVVGCYAEGCPGDEICLDGECVEDPCDLISCEAESYCRDGICIPSCAGVACEAGARCEDGECVEDPCADARCAEGRVCAEGACIWDPCAGVSCPAPLICLDGACAPDPCERVRCGEGQRCERGQCFNVEDPQPDDSPRPLPAPDAGRPASGGSDAGEVVGMQGEGVACGLSLRPAAPGWLALALLLVVRRRR